MQVVAQTPKKIATKGYHEPNDLLYYYENKIKSKDSYAYSFIVERILYLLI
jgi:hypothetical protein